MNELDAADLLMMKNARDNAIKAEEEMLSALYTDNDEVLRCAAELQVIAPSWIIEVRWQFKDEHDFEDEHFAIIATHKETRESEQAVCRQDYQKLRQAFMTKMVKELVYDR